MKSKKCLFISLLITSNILWCAYQHDVLAMFKLNSEQFIQLIENSSVIGAKDKRNRSLVHFAVVYNKPDHLVLLLTHGANPNAIDNEHETPLHYAAWRGSAQLTDILLRAGANPALQNMAPTLDTPLHIAARHHHYDTAKRLIASGAPVNIQNHRGKTPLHAAVKKRDVALTQLLLDNGADLTIFDKHGRTPLYVATHMHIQSPEIIRMLTERSAATATTAADCEPLSTVSR